MSTGKLPSQWSKCFLPYGLITCELSHLDWVGSEVCPIVVLWDQIVDLKISAFFSGKDGLMRKVANQKHILALFEGQRWGLSQNREYYLNLSLLADAQNVSIFSHAVYFVLDDDRACEFVAVGCNGPALLQVFLVHEAHLTLKYYCL